jgi:hypothetical protein
MRVWITVMLELGLMLRNNRVKIPLDCLWSDSVIILRGLTIITTLKSGFSFN